MKKILLVMALMIGISCSAKINLQGTWISENTELTFTGDSLTIDDIGNEGFTYSYTVDTLLSTINVESDEIYCDTFAIEIMDITDNTLSIRYSDSDTVYEFNRK